MDINVDKIRKRELNEINRWYYNDKNNSIINLICEPYQNLDSLDNFVIDKIKNNKKILYVSNKKKYIKLIEKYKGLIDFSDSNNIYKIRELYNIVIYDDVSFFYDKNDLEVKEDIAFLLRRTKKLIICSIEPILNNILSIEIINFKEKKHFLEPRVITTRLDLSTSMPYILYDYLNWFNQEGRMVIIYTPNKVRDDEIFMYYTKTLRLQKDIYVLQSKEKELLSDINRIRFKDKSSIIITHELHEYIDSIKDVDVIFYFADDKFFNYKKILFTCGALTKDNTLDREVLIVCNDETKNIEQSKSISRRYNKFIWEQVSENL